MAIPCMVEGTKGIRFSDEFTIRTTIKADIIGGKQAIFSKRVPLSIGNRPGIAVLLHGSCIEFMTFADGATHWITSRTLPRVISVGQKYEILIFRSGPICQIYINGFNRTNKKFKNCHSGSLNSDMDIIFGGQIYDTADLTEKFTGKIYSVELFDQAYTSSASPLRYPKNPFAFPLKQLPVMKERLNLPIEIRR